VRSHPLLLPPELRARNGGERLLAMLAECAVNERLPAGQLAGAALRRRCLLEVSISGPFKL